MRTLKIGMCGLPASDEQLIRNLMRMFAHDPMFHWALCDDKELDVLVMSASPLTDSKPRRCYRAALLLSDSRARRACVDAAAAGLRLSRLADSR